MKIAIAAMTRDEKAEISHQGARAVCYLVYDETGKLCDVIENPFKDYDRAVGLHVADYLAEKSVSAVVAAHIGSGFERSLDAKGIRHIESEGIISDVVEELAARLEAD
jgi:predicted Fe-Mo cluster-binding NifX family protein